MRLPATMALSPLCLAALLSGCGAARAPDIRLIEQPAPRHLLVCADRPEPPGSGRTQRDVALFVLALSAAHGECRARLAAVASLLERPRP